MVSDPTGTLLSKLKLVTNNITRGPGFLKFSTSLLTDKEYINIIKNLIRTKIIEYNEHQFTTDLILEMIALDVRGESVKYSKNKK